MIREVSLLLDGTLYTAVYDPPLKRGEKLSDLRRHIGIPARVDGAALFVKWPDGKEAKTVSTLLHCSPSLPRCQRGSVTWNYNSVVVSRAKAEPLNATVQGVLGRCVSAVPATCFQLNF